MRSTLRKAYYRGSYQTRIGAMLNYLNTLAINFSSEETYLTVDIDGVESYITFDLE